jgi:hypothetical protein
VSLRFRNGTLATSRSFSASFVFGILCHDPDACSHGIGLFVAPEKYNLSAVFPSQYINLVNDTTPTTTSSASSSIDTDQNNEFSDIDGNHVSVDVRQPPPPATTTTMAPSETRRIWTASHGALK